MKELSFPLYSNFSLAGWQSGLHTTPDALCLHGWLDNANSFLPLSHALESLSLLALDFAGHGLSSHRSRDAHYHFLDYVHDIASVLKEHFSPITLIGHSMGGMVASVVAAIYPEVVKKLILIDSFGLVTGHSESIVNQLRVASESRWQSAQAKKAFYADRARAVQSRLRKGELDLQSAAFLAERGLEETNEGFRWRSDLRLRESSMYRILPEQVDVLLRAIQCPVIAVLANDGAQLMQAARERYSPCYSNLTVYEVHGGHHCHMTNTQEVAAIILSHFS